MLRRAVVHEASKKLSGVGFKILLYIFASVKRRLAFGEIPYTFRARHAGESKLESTAACSQGRSRQCRHRHRPVQARISWTHQLGALRHRRHSRGRRMELRDDLRLHLEKAEASTTPEGPMLAKMLEDPCIDGHGSPQQASR